MPDSCDDGSTLREVGVGGDDSRAAIRQPLELLDRQADIAQGDLPSDEKRELLCTHIGTLQV